jgi:hypothetical protein
MKKVGFLALVIITVFTTLGVGFSMWSQTVAVSGNVNTGKVTLTVDDPTGTWGYKNLDNDATVVIYAPGTVATGPTGGDHPPVNNILVGYAAINNITGQTVNATWSNLFPIPPGSNIWWIDFRVTNTGTIPVKFHVSPNPPILNPSTPSNVPTFLVQYGPHYQAVTGDIEGFQLEPGLNIQVDIGLVVGEDTVQSYQGTFTFSIVAQQWNEYSGT